jgi:hypothetical protein
MVAVIILIVILAVSAAVFYIDPFFHYHKPRPELYYSLNGDYDRYQNDGILRNFDYDALLVGNSLMANFRTSEFDTEFGTVTVKTSNAGGAMREFGDLVKAAFKSDNDIRYVFYELDMSNVDFDRGHRRADITDFPDYLYNDNVFDDIYYLFNRDVIFHSCYTILSMTREKGSGGIDSFDDYSAFAQGSQKKSYGKLAFRNIRSAEPPEQVLELSDDDRDTELDNLRYNLTDIADAHPDTCFMVYIPPVGIVQRGMWYTKGILEKKQQEEEAAVEELLCHPNIRIFSWNNDTELTLDYTQYMDELHYGPWVNSQMVKDMAAGSYEITADSADEYFRIERDLYMNYDYISLLKAGMEEQQ